MLPCQSEQSVKQHLVTAQQQHPNANHIVFAYRIHTEKGLISRFHDAGEPSGTAGKPVFQHIEGNQLINALLIVIRYFGGVKLGAGGLTRAYGNAAKQLVERATIKPFIEMTEIQLSIKYDQLQHLTYHLKKLNGDIIEQNFADNIHIKIRLPKEKTEYFSQVIKQL